MLTQIKAGPKAGGPARPAESLAEALRAGDGGDAIDLLLGCHTRIRHFTAVAVRLSQAAATAPPQEIASAARSVCRYYEVALPLHEADENESVYPRLRRAAPAGELAEANQAMVDQHVTIDRIIARLVEHWRQIAGEPGRAAERATASRADAEALQTAWDEHLALEERMIFPALRSHLTADDLAGIRAEMHERRRAS